MADSKLLDMLPPVWRRNDLMRGLANAIGEPFDYWRTLLGARGRYFDPEGAPAAWLDYLLRLTAWPPMRDFSERRRRNLVKSAARIWDRKGTVPALEFAMEAVGGIDAQVTQAPQVAFIAGVNVAGDVCGPGANAYRYTVEAPGATVEEVERVLGLVQPAWTEATVDASNGTSTSRPSGFAPARPAKAPNYPTLDDRSAEEVADQVKSNLPAELTYRESDALAFQLVDTIRDHMYAELLLRLNETPKAVEEWLVEDVFGVRPLPAQPASVTLEFTAASGAGTVTVPEGTTAKTGSGADAYAFETNEAIDVSGGNTTSVQATATEPGADVNDIAVGEIDQLDQPISGVDSVTNSSKSKGGEDAEPYEVMIQRWREEMRAGRPARVVSPGDVARQALITPDPDIIDARVERAWVRAAGTWNDTNDDIVDQAGSVAIAVLDEQLNPDPNSQTSQDLRQAVVDAYDGLAPDDVTWDVHQPEPRRVHITQVDVVLGSGEDQTEVQEQAKEALENYLTAKGESGSGRREIAHPGWEWGRALHLNELVSLLHDVDGIDRLEDAFYRYSDDGGQTWTNEQALVKLEAAADGNPADWGLLDWQSSPNKTFTLNTV